MKRPVSSNTGSPERASPGARFRPRRPAPGTAPPARLAELRASSRRIGEVPGKLLAGEAMLGVGLPVDVSKGELQECAEALFARPQRLLGAFVIRQRPSEFPAVRAVLASDSTYCAADRRVKGISARKPRRSPSVPQDQRHQLHFECRPCPMERRRVLSRSGASARPTPLEDSLHVCVWIHTFTCDAARTGPGRGPNAWCDPCLEEGA
jgi:hypothetical protein